MPKSRRRRTARHRDPFKEMRRRLAAPAREPRPKHTGYEQVCSDEVMIDEFGEEGATWLLEEYGRPLTLAEFTLERSIRMDDFLMDDPFTGPEVITAAQLSKVLTMTTDFILSMAEQQEVLSPEQARGVSEIKAMPPVNHAAEGIDVVRIAFQDGAIFLNDRGMWDFGA